jgi:hypothetical protein
MTAHLSMNVLLAIQVTLMAALLVFVIPLVWMAKRAKKVQNGLIESLDRHAANAWFRINLARPAQFSSRLKLIPFEAKGLLVNAPDQVRIIAELRSGERIDRSIPKRELALRWIGNPGLASSNMHWIAVGPADQALYLSADTGFNALQSREATSDLCRIIDPDFKLPAIATSEFALEKNPASLGIVVAFFLILAFAFLDGIVLNKNELLQYGWLAWAAPGAAFLAVPAYWWLVRRGVPSRESMALMMFLGFAIVGAFVPAAKRVDQLLSAGGPTRVAYLLGPNASLTSATAGPPAIHQAHVKEYWEQFAQGSTHYFDLRHGPLGLWQLDHTTLDEQLREFYERSGKNKKGSK